VLKMQATQLLFAYKGEGKGNIRPRTGHEGPEREYFSFNLGARWGGWSTTRPGRFTPGKDPVPIV
jgi:hypothetical protein